MFTPFRLEFGGGGTDIPSYPGDGYIINMTIPIGVYTEITKGSFKVIADDRIKPMVEKMYETIVTYFTLKYGIKKSGILNIHCDTLGGGLGSSSSICVAIIRSVSRYLDICLDDQEIFAIAYNLERIYFGMKGGWQDQKAAIYKGLNVFTKFTVEGLDVDEEIFNWLIVVDTEESRRSSDIIEEQSKLVEDKMKIYEQLENIARFITVALRKKDYELFGKLLSMAWDKKREVANIETIRMNNIYKIGLSLGAIGGRGQGAGRGGHMLFCVYPKDKERIKNEFKNDGIKCLDI